MSDDTNIGLKTRLLRAWAWVLANPVAAAALAGALTGFLLAVVVF